MRFDAIGSCADPTTTVSLAPTTFATAAAAKQAASAAATPCLDRRPSAAWLESTTQPTGPQSASQTTSDDTSQQTAPVAVSAATISSKPTASAAAHVRCGAATPVPRVLRTIQPRKMFVFMSLYKNGEYHHFIHRAPYSEFDSHILECQKAFHAGIYRSVFFNKKNFDSFP
jgi:hypothetical protein